MSTRRKFITIISGSFLGGGDLLGALLSAVQWAYATSRKVLARGTKRDSLIDENPATLDATNLAYQVNGMALPRRHGFPLRVVAEDDYGSDWIKYVDRITVEGA